MRPQSILFFCFIIISCLFSRIAFSSEKIYFYYTDPAGTPLVMTDQGGTVVWRADYKPFGEEKALTGTIENSDRFAGKKKDTETGLYYFGARYMKDRIGRFSSPDPVGAVDPTTSKTNYQMLANPQKLNRYAYALNNPYKYLDSNGEWPEQVHNTIIEKAFSSGGYKLSPDVMAALKRGSAKADTHQYQDPVHSYMHAMRNGCNKQTVDEAKGLMHDYIEQKVHEYKVLMSQGKTKQAYEALGMAMHPLMDATSPSHEDFQPWNGLVPLIDGTTIEAIVHKRREGGALFKANPDYLRRSTDSIRRQFDEVN